MDWVKFVIPLIALAVWILSNLARTKEEQPRRARSPRNRSDNPAPQQKTRRTPEEVDRLIEQARQRRREAERRRQQQAQASSAQTQSRQPAKPPETLQPIEPKKKPSERKQLDWPEQQRRRHETAAAESQAAPIPAEVISAGLMQGQSVPLAEDLGEEIVVAKIVDSIGRTKRQRAREESDDDEKSRKVRGTLYKLLRNKRNLQAAVLLKEVLGTPPSKSPFGTRPMDRS